MRQSFDARLKFGFTVHYVSAHMFLHFIDRIQCDYPEYVQNQINFEEIDWQQMIANSYELGNFTYKNQRCCSWSKKQPQISDAKTVGGKRLLQIMIDSENKTNFYLRDLMELMLENNLIETNVFDFQG